MSIGETGKLPGIFGGEPRSPYPRSEGMESFRFSPSHMLCNKKDTCVDISNDTRV